MPKNSLKKLLTLAISFLFVLLVVLLDPKGEVFGPFNKNLKKSYYFENCVPKNISEDATSTFLDVVEVSDGDTITVSKNCEPAVVRMIGVDTPETVDPRKPVQCFGNEASAYTKERLSGEKVLIEIDPTESEKDKYGRTLGYVILEDGTNYNKEIIEMGYAHEYTYQNSKYKYQTEFKQAEQSAKESGRGLWATSTCNGITK